MFPAGVLFGLRRRPLSGRLRTSAFERL